MMEPEPEVRCWTLNGACVCESFRGEAAAVLLLWSAAAGACLLVGRWWAGLVIFAAWYLAFAVRAPVLTHQATPRNEQLLQRCPRLRGQLYWPFFLAAQADLAVLFYVLRSAHGTKPRFRREELAMEDGGLTAIDWLDPTAAQPSWLGNTRPPEVWLAQRPVVAICPGVTSGSDDLATRAIASAAVRRGYRAAVLIRRGHGGLALRTPRLNVFGDTRDTHEAISRIHAANPAVPIAVVGISAGSAIAVRYSAEQGVAAQCGPAAEFPEGWARRSCGSAKSAPPPAPSPRRSSSRAAATSGPASPGRRRSPGKRVATDAPLKRPGGRGSPPRGGATPSGSGRRREKVLPEALPEKIEAAATGYMGRGGLVCCVAVCPGYDLSVCTNRTRWPYAGIMQLRIVEFFLRGPTGRDVKQESLLHGENAAAVEAAKSALTTEDAIAALGAFAAVGKTVGGIDKTQVRENPSGRYTSEGAVWSEYLTACNPMVPLRPKPADATVPSLIINARDDPISVWRNVRENRNMFLESSVPILCETVRGSHVAFFDFWGGDSWLDEAVMQFIAAAIELDEATVHAAAVAEADGTTSSDSGAPTVAKQARKPLEGVAGSELGTAPLYRP